MGWTKFVGPAASLLLAGLTAFNDPIQQVIVAHPAWSGVFAALGIAAASFAPQPHK